MGEQLSPLDGRGQNERPRPHQSRNRQRNRRSHDPRFTVMQLLAYVAMLTLLSILTGCTTLSSPTFADQDGAIRGYDPVAYHTAQMPVKGHPSLAITHNGETWFFSSRQNLELFRDDPARYAPQYGGYCAYAMSRGFVVSIDPEAWRVVDQKLYLNYSPAVRETWLKDVPGNIAKADANWQKKIAQPVFE